MNVNLRNSMQQISQVTTNFVQGKELASDSKIGNAIQKVMSSIPRFEAKQEGVLNSKLSLQLRLANATWGSSLVIGGVLLSVACPPVVIVAAASALLHSALKNQAKSEKNENTGGKNEKSSIFSESEQKLINSNLAKIEQKMQFTKNNLEGQKNEYMKALNDLKEYNDNVKNKKIEDSPQQREHYQSVANSQLTSLQNAKNEIKLNNKMISLIKNEQKLKSELNRLEDSGKDEIPFCKSIISSGIEKNKANSKVIEGKMHALVEEFKCDSKLKEAVTACASKMHQAHADSEEKAPLMVFLSLVSSGSAGLKFDATAACKGVTKDSNDATNLPSEFINDFHKSLPSYLGVGSAFKPKGGLDGDLSPQERATNREEFSKMEMFKGVEKGLVDQHVSVLEEKFFELTVLRREANQGGSASYLDKAIEFKNHMETIKSEISAKNAQPESNIEKQSEPAGKTNMQTTTAEPKPKTDDDFLDDVLKNAGFG